MGSMRNSTLEVLVQSQWHTVNALLDETAITLGSVEAADDSFANMPMAMENEKRHVRIVKQEGSGLGISIQGGADNSNSRPIVISKIFPNMSAALSGQLFVGDVILAVNGEPLINAKHDEAVRALKRAGQVVDLQVQLRRDLLGKRDNLLQKLTWDDDEQSYYDPRMKSFSLKLAFVTRTSLDREDIENRTFEIRSHSAHHVLTLRCSSATEADVWFESVHACAEALLTQALAQVNLILGQNPRIFRMGWLAEQDVRNGSLAWKPIFAALTTNDLLFYESVPALKQEWAMPILTRPLIATRVVQTTARTFPVIAGLSDVISFTLRTGTQDGIRAHLLRVETHRDLSSWVKSIIHCTYEACTETGQVTARKFAIESGARNKTILACIWQDQECEIVIQLDKGISLINRATAEIIWQHPFESIRVSGDDGRRYLWIDFGQGQGEQEIDLLGSPKAVVFILHSFLATKVYQSGLYA
ncbi:hypothetical protein M3Y95_00750600 [Aphelenchoides besseyi]|nr:hypothetical protein M3Y95_00750600 [Aphelenchoides besseyi]